jgi:CO/xanthine dehydrogenase Mo-binding subunit
LTPHEPHQLTGLCGFSLGFHLPFDESVAHAQAVQELNAWVVIHPDDKVVIRIARSEMGQGTLTGLCQLVAEELECDWNKVTWEYPTPGENRPAKGGCACARPAAPHAPSAAATPSGRAADAAA